MRKIKVFIAFFLFIHALTNPASAKIFKAGFNLNYYSVKDSIYQDVYGTGSIMYGASLSANLIGKIEVRTEANYLQDRGSMTATQEELKFTLIPFVIGARVKMLEKKFSPYIGFGIDLCSYKEDYPERFKDVNETATGYHVETGTYLFFPLGIYIDVNVRYVKLDVEPFEELIKLGGLRAGIGIGYRF